MKNITIQMELTMNKDQRSLRNSDRKARHQRARLWFARMREVVDLLPAPRPARPEQTYLGLRQSNLL